MPTEVHGTNQSAARIATLLSKVILCVGDRLKRSAAIERMEGLERLIFSSNHEKTQ